MRCPKCSYISFDHLEACKSCGHDLTETNETMHGSAMKVKAPYFFESALGPEEEALAPIEIKEPAEEVEEEADLSFVEEESEEGIDFQLEPEDDNGGIEFDLSDEYDDENVEEPDLQLDLDDDSEGVDFQLDTDLVLDDEEEDSPADTQEDTIDLQENIDSELTEKQPAGDQTADDLAIDSDAISLKMKNPVDPAEKESFVFSVGGDSDDEEDESASDSPAQEPLIEIDGLDFGEEEDDDEAPLSTPELDLDDIDFSDLTEPDNDAGGTASINSTEDQAEKDAQTADNDSFELDDISDLFDIDDEDINLDEDQDNKNK